MLWLKRNLVLVAVILAGLLLAGGGGYYVWVKYAENKGLDDELGNAKQELENLLKSKPSPSQANLDAVRGEIKKTQGYMADARHLFSATPYSPLNSQTYRSLLETTVADLRRLATQSGVDVSSNYNFSFEPQIHKVSFEPASIKPLTEQLTEIATVSRELFKARVHHLDVIRRVACSEYDAQNAAEILGGGFHTNRTTGMVTWPYEITFDCFSADLARVLTGLSQVPRMLIVKTISVQPSPASQNSAFGLQDSGAGAPPPVASPVHRRGAPPGATGAAGTPKPTELKTALEEKLLRVVLQVHVVKPAS